MHEPPPLSELARASLAGDAAAGKELVERLYPLVLHIVRAHRARRTGGDDLTQEVFLKMFSRLAQYRGDSPFEHWVSRLAVTTCLDRLKHERRRPEWRRADLGEAEAKVFDDLLAGAFDPESADAIAAREVAGRLLDLLKPEERALLTWLDLDGETVAVVAARMGLGESAIKMRALRARRRLRETAEALRRKGLL